MNHHEFVHEMAMIHAAVRKVLAKLPAVYKSERKELMSIKSKIEGYIILPDEIITKEEV
jgi:hypothetical protein